jgi:hypothetical protein
LFEQNSWVKTSGHAPGSVIAPPGGFPQGHDPNDFTSLDSMQHWLRHADYYDQTSMQGLIYFSSLEELHEIARQSVAFYQDAHDRMRAFYDRRRRLAIDGWGRILAEIR